MHKESERDKRGLSSPESNSPFSHVGQAEQDEPVKDVQGEQASFVSGEHISTLQDTAQNNYLEAPQNQSTEAMQAFEKGTQSNQEENWRKFSKFTPWAGLARMWAGLLAALTAFFFQGIQESEAIQDLGDLLIRLGWKLAAWAFLGFAVISLISLIFAIISWRHASYKFDAEGIHRRSGVLFKKHAHIRWDRIHSVDMRRRLFAKITGQGDLVIDSGAWDDGKKFTLGLFSVEECEKIRVLILQAADDVRHGKAPCLEVDEKAGVEKEKPFYALEYKRLLMGMTFSWACIAGIIAFVFSLVLFLLNEEGFSLIPLALLILGPVWNAVQRFNRSWAFTLELTKDGFSTKSGFTSTITTIILPSRVQAIRVKQPLLWRRFDWWVLDISIAGAGAELSEEGTSRLRLLPMGTSEEVTRALWAILPDLGVTDPLAFLHEGMEGTGEGAFFQSAPISSRWLDPIGYKRNAVAITETVAVFRWGRVWNRNLRFFLHNRFQGLALSRGPMQRRLNLASIDINMSGMNFSASQSHLGYEAALAFVQNETLMGRRARKSNSSESIDQWRRRVGVAGSKSGGFDDAELKDTAALVGEAVFSDPKGSQSE